MSDRCTQCSKPVEDCYCPECPICGRPPDRQSDDRRKADALGPLVDAMLVAFPHIEKVGSFEGPVQRVAEKLKIAIEALEEVEG